MQFTGKLFSQKIPATEHSREHSKKPEKKTVTMEKENNPFQLVGLAFAVIPTSGRAMATTLSLGYAAEIHHATSHLVLRALL